MKNRLVWTDVECNNRDAFESAITKSSGNLILDGHFGTYDIVKDAQKFAETTDLMIGGQPRA